MIHSACSQHFDMACTDQGDSWTCAPGCNINVSVRNHVRMMSAAGESSSEIILDSGEVLYHFHLVMLVSLVMMSDFRITLMHRVASWTYVTHVLQLST